MTAFKELDNESLYDLAGKLMKASTVFEESLDLKMDFKDDMENLNWLYNRLSNIEKSDYNSQDKLIGEAYRITLSFLSRENLDEFNLIKNLHSKSDINNYINASRTERSSMIKLTEIMSRFIISIGQGSSSEQPYTQL